MGEWVINFKSLLIHKIRVGNDFYFDQNHDDEILGGGLAQKMKSRVF